jgi:ABC-type multidrug transport system ATPase subunit
MINTHALCGASFLCICVGSSKSSLLKALSGRLPSSSMYGSLQYNGRTASELAADGVHLKRLTAYVGQLDLHFPSLTVRETVTFATRSSVADTALLPGARDDMELMQMDRGRADMLIELIGLGECADTFVGNDMLRGVSGGQRKVKRNASEHTTRTRARTTSADSNRLSSYVCGCMCVSSV